MSKPAAFTLLGLMGVFALGLFAANAADPSPSQPVLIVLYSRFYDHSHSRTNYERIQRLLKLLDTLNSKYPKAGVSALFQFSGTTSQLLADENANLQLVDRIKDYEKRGLLEVGYTGEDEPSYLHRPKANLLLAKSPEDRWNAKSEAADHFLSDFKNPVTGDPVPGLSGGLKRTQEVFGPVSFLSGTNPSRMAQGGDSFVTNQIRRLNQTAVLMGIPTADPRRGIEGGAVSANQFSKAMSPEAHTSPEVFWADEFLRLSAISVVDNNKPHTTDESLDALKTVFAKLDRSHVRVVRLEIGSYLRYLTKRADGSVVIDPMEWLYYHPDDARIPPTLKPMVSQTAIEKGYENEEEVLKWLLGEFLAANPGSRVVSMHELSRLAADSEGGNVNHEQLKELATNLKIKFEAQSNQVPNYAQCGNRYFSLAESFELLAHALAVLEKKGSLPESEKSLPVYGPIYLPNTGFVNTGGVTVAEVIHSAAHLDARLSDSTWKTLPDNSIPAIIQVGSLQLNAGQFLRLMALAYLDPVPDRKIMLGGLVMYSQATFMFPSNSEIIDAGVGWTYKPAVLNVDAAAATAAATNR